VSRPLTTTLGGDIGRPGHQTAAVNSIRKQFGVVGAVLVVGACGGLFEVEQNPPEGYLLSQPAVEGAFGQTVVGAPKEIVVGLGDLTILTEPLKVRSITATGKGVQMWHECGANYEHANCQIRVRFAPTAPGPMAGELRVLSNHRGGPLVLPLSGLAVAGAQPQLPIGVFDEAVDTTLANAIDLGTVERGRSVTRSFVLRNVGNATGPLPLALGAGSDWALATDCDQPLAPAATCTASLRFTPTIAAPTGAVLDIADGYRTPGFVRQAVRISALGR
jgi:hypothetical protein